MKSITAALYMVVVASLAFRVESDSIKWLDRLNSNASISSILLKWVLGVETHKIHSNQWVLADQQAKWWQGQLLEMESWLTHSRCLHFQWILLGKGSLCKREETQTWRSMECKNPFSHKSQRGFQVAVALQLLTWVKTKSIKIRWPKWGARKSLPMFRCRKMKLNRLLKSRKNRLISWRQR